MSRPTFDEVWLAVAETVALRTTCGQGPTGNGCVLVDQDHAVLATGYNGPPRGMPHCTEHPCPGAAGVPGEGLYKCVAVHAEQNALIRCARPQDVHTCYCTTSPCIRCMTMLLNTGVRRLVFRREHHHHQAARDLWFEAGRGPFVCLGN